MKYGKALNGPLFQGLTEQDTLTLLEELDAKFVHYTKGSYIFQEEEASNFLYLLVKGKVAIGKSSYTGKQMIATVFTEPGEMFGEVYGFLDKPFEYFAVAEKETDILEVPLTFLSKPQTEGSTLQSMLVHNLLHILAEKAYYLNRKLQVMASGNLRQKLVKLLLDAADEGGKVNLSFSRQALAEYLSVARPSLSREMMNMQKEGLISVDGQVINILRKDQLENYL